MAEWYQKWLVEQQRPGNNFTHFLAWNQKVMTSQRVFTGIDPSFRKGGYVKWGYQRALTFPHPLGNKSLFIRSGDLSLGQCSIPPFFLQPTPREKPLPIFFNNYQNSLWAHAKNSHGSLASLHYKLTPYLAYNINGSFSRKSWQLLINSQLAYSCGKFNRVYVLNLSCP